MNSVKIIVKGGTGRIENPYFKLIDGEMWRLFEHDVISYPAPGIKDGTHMAGLQWQAYAIGRNDWYDLSQIESKRLKKYEKTREVWVLSPVIDAQTIEKALRSDGYLDNTVEGKERLEMFDKVFGPPEFEPDVKLPAEMKVLSPDGEGEKKDQKTLLEKAFNAGIEYGNECFCEVCDYCLNNPKKAPDFKEWLNINPIK